MKTNAILRLMLASSALLAPAVCYAQAEASGDPSAAQAAPSADRVDAGTPASDKSSDQGLAEIVVTAQKRSENLQRVPIAISTLSQDVIQKTGILSTQGLATVLPGLQVFNLGSSLSPRVRGVGAGFIAAGVESPIATYVDGIYRPFARDIEVDYDDVEQVALLKGPQGTLFGRNATGGVLQITTRQPSSHFGGSFRTSLDNYLTTRSNLFVTGGLSDGVAGSISLSYATQGKGYGKNFTTGNPNNKLDHSLSGRAKLKVEVGPRTTLNLVADYRDSAGPLAFGARTVPGFGTINPAPEPGNAWDTNEYIDPLEEFKGGGGSAKLDQDLGFATLSLISGYRDAKAFTRFSTVTSPTPASLVLINYKSQQFTQEVQLVSPADGRFTWTLGGFYFWNKANVDLLFNFFDPQVSAVLNSSHPITEQTTSSIAAFAQGTLKITDKTRVTGGIRYTYDHTRFNGSSANAFRTTLPPFIPPFLAGQTVVATQSGKITLKKPTWRLALDHDLADHVMLYASWNRGVKSGGFNTSAVGDPPVGGERLDAFEGGMKSQFLGNSLRVNLGGFYYKYANLQVPVYNNGIPALRNAGAAELYGADLDVQAQLSSQLKINGSMNWLHARFTRFDDAPIGVPNPGFQGATFPPGLSAAGKTIPNSPSATYSIGIDYRIDTGSGPIDLNANDNFNSGFYSEADNLLRQKSYHLVNASVRWTSLDGNFSARVFAENILNEAVASLLATTGTGYNYDVSNPPFRVGAGITVNF